jgi:hypothetical protein
VRRSLASNLRPALLGGLLGVLGLTVVGVGLAGSEGVRQLLRPTASTATKIPASPTSTQLEILRDRLVSGAAEMGESHPTSGYEVATTRRAFFEALNGSEIYDDAGVYVTVARGNFVAYGASRPAGVPPPKGGFVFAVYDAESLEMTDWGVLDQPVDVSEMGPSQPLELTSDG